MLPLSLSFILSLSILFKSVVAFPDDDHDLTTFVSRPDIKVPKFSVKVHNKDHVSPGYWFVAPYWQIRPEEETNRYMPCQIGPHIYDGEGTLVWTGSCRFRNSNVFDFNTVEIDNRTHISFMHNSSPDLEQNRGYGLILDEEYHETATVPTPDYVNMFNMHEFNVIDNGKTALSTLYKPEEVDMTDLKMVGKGWVTSGGIFEQDVATGEVTFQWDGVEHIPLNESSGYWPTSPPPSAGDAFDYVHVNSVDKTPDGDYLLSSRFTDTVFLISGNTSEIIWRLGGKYDDFEHDFSFRRQHHVRHVKSDGALMTISMLNNAADEWSDDGTPSSAFFIEIDSSASPMTAKLVNHYDRPDGQLTQLRGSTQLLSDGNIFVGWSAQGYHSEFTHDGELVMEARFISDRYSSYRSYKSKWTGRPSTPPDVKSMAFGSTTSDISTTIWVSWNGATDIASWNFYGQASSKSKPVLLGNATKSDFETMFMASGYMGWVTAEALDADGNAIGTSDVEETTAPDNWKAAGFDAEEDTPDPMDPNMVIQNKEADAASQSSTVQIDSTFNQTAHGNFTELNETFSEAVSSAVESKDALVTFCIALIVVVGCGILFGFAWFLRSYLKKRQSKKSYLPVASEAEGDEGRIVMRETNNI